MNKRYSISTAVWFTLFAIGMLFVILVGLYTVGFGDARRIAQGETTLFLMSRGAILYVLGFSCIPFFLGCAVASRGGVFWLFSAPLFVVSATFLIVVGPTVWGDRVEVSANHFWSSHGFWFAPIDHRVEFTSMLFMEVRLRGVEGPAGPSYDLWCSSVDGTKTAIVPVGDLMRVALPEIIAAATASGVNVLGADEIDLPSPGLPAAEPFRNSERGFKPRFFYGFITMLALIVCFIWFWDRKRRMTSNQPKPFDATLVCYGLYLVAIVVLVVTFGPSENGFETEGGQTFGLVIAMIALATGALGHVILWFRGQSPTLSEQKRWIALVVITGPLILGISWLESSEVGFNILFVLIGVVMSALIIAYLWASWYLRNLPMNRMAVLIQQEKYEEAIAIGEAQPAENRHPAVTLNMAVSLHRVGRHSEAGELLTALQARTDLPEVFRKAIEQLETELSGEKF